VALAIFDLDNTLLGGDSDYSWGQFLCRKGIVDAAEYTRINTKFYEDYERGDLEISAFLEFALQSLKDNDLATLNKLHDEFMQEVIEPMILPKGLALLEKHREQGDYLMIITATNSFVTSPIGDRLNVEYLIGTDPEMINGQYTGKVAGTPAFQDGKVIRLNAWLNENGSSLEGSYFYSDSQNDIPLLDLVDYPFAVDPSPELAQYAKDRGWPVMSLR
jgi:HAD superfamily hydrolase (TIGR01490 family)